jgi:hypothetical protein
LELSLGSTLSNTSHFPNAIAMLNQVGGILRLIMQLAARTTVRFATFLALAGGLLAACSPADTVSTGETPGDPVENAPTPPAEPAVSATLTGIPVGTHMIPPEDLVARRAQYSATLRRLTPDNVAKHLQFALDNGFREIVSIVAKESMKDGSGRFSMTRWRALADQWKGTGPIFQKYVTSGTLIGIYVIDEPYCPTCWGGKPPTMAELLEMGRHVKALLGPTVPTIVRAPPTWFVSRVSPAALVPAFDASWCQWAYGPNQGVTASQYAAKCVQDAKRMGLKLIMGMNVLNGGDGSSGIRGTDSRYWQVSAAELTRYDGNFVTNPGVCALSNWQFSPIYPSSGMSAGQLAQVRAFDNRTDVKAALKAINLAAKARPYMDCRRH